MQKDFNQIQYQQLKQIDILSYKIYKVRNECDIYDFASKHSISTNECIFEDKSLKRGHYVVVKPRDYIIHIVRPNQTIEEISRLYNTTPDQILKDNSIHTIFVGEQLKII